MHRPPELLKPQQQDRAIKVCHVMKIPVPLQLTAMEGPRGILEAEWMGLDSSQMLLSM
jgi:hypothetical protein